MTTAETTVVTALYPLPSSKYTFTQYKSWLQNLCKIPCHLVIFTNEELALEIYKWRKQFLSQTEVIVRKLDTFAMACPKMMEVWKEQHSGSNNDSPELYALWAMKQECVRIVINKNSFQSKYFVWCDAAIHRYSELQEYYMSFPKDIHRLCKASRMTFLELEPIPESYVTDWIEKKPISYPLPPILLGAGCMAGDAKAWQDLGEAYKETVKEFLINKWPCGKDTDIYFVILMTRKTEPFRLFYANRFITIEGIEWLSLPPMLGGTIDAALDMRFEPDE